MAKLGAAAVAIIGLLLASPVAAGPFFFSTGNPDGRMATASRPGSTGGIEIESADDFIVSQSALINHATFTGLLPTDALVSSILGVNVEIYRVFPLDSTVPPSGNVPTRNNSPSDDAFATFDSGSGELTFVASVLNPSFAASNSVINGIHKIPGQTTGGEGPVRGEEVLFDISFTSPFLLPSDHYFFVPQVLLSSGNFLWLSAPKPITGGSGPFAPDLQSWIRNADLDPDWLRIGTDIVGGTPAPNFNATFSLTGETVPEPDTLALLGLGLAGLLVRRRASSHST